MRENALLKNRFSKRSRSRWTGVPSAKSAKLRLISSRNKTKDVGSESERIGRGQAARRNEQSRTQDFATLDSTLLIVLRWRRILGSGGMTLRYCCSRCILQPAQSAVV